MSKRIYQSKKSSEIQRELDEMGVEFIRRPYDLPHEVPINFWKEQREKVLQNVEKKVEPNKGFINNYRRLFYLTSAAAMLLLLIWVSSEQEDISDTDLNLDSIELSALEEYLLDEAENLDARLSLEETFYSEELWINEDPQNDNNDK